MNLYQSRLSVEGFASLAIAPAILVLVLANATLAQRGSPGGSSPNMDRARESGVREHQQQLQVLLNSKEPGRPGEERRLQAIIEQTKQDFDRIQVLNRELVNTAGAGGAFNYRGLTDMAAEIRKRAKRLRDNISLPPSDDQREPLEKREGEINREEMKGALLMLSKRIMSFTTNPLFQTTHLIDARLGAKASRDLEVIVELSGQIKKSAEKLGKSPQ